MCAKFDPEWFRFHVKTSRLSEEVQEAVDGARYGLFFSTRFDPAAPLAAFGRQAKVLAIAAPDALAVHDAATQGMDSGDRFRAIASWSTPPHPKELYDVHAVWAPGNVGRSWVHTHGLERCGIPDIDLLRVPDDLVVSAWDLIGAFVRARLGTKVPLRDFDDDLVSGHRVSWVPAGEAARKVHRPDIGGVKCRRQAPSHARDRIVIVEDPTLEEGAGPPLDLLRLFEDGDPLVYVHPAEVERAARLARERWGVFEGLLARHGDDDGWSFRVCVALRTCASGRESMWWEVETVKDGRLRARLEVDPVGVHDLRRGDFRWHDLSDVADWAVHSPEHEISPGTYPVPA
jgi:hypothetical protein